MFKWENPLKVNDFGGTPTNGNLHMCHRWNLKYMQIDHQIVNIQMFFLVRINFDEQASDL